MYICCYYTSVKISTVSIDVVADAAVADAVVADAAFLVLLLKLEKDRPPGIDQAAGQLAFDWPLM